MKYRGGGGGGGGKWVLIRITGGSQYEAQGALSST